VFSGLIDVTAEAEGKGGAIEARHSGRPALEAGQISVRDRRRASRSLMGDAGTAGSLHPTPRAADFDRKSSRLPTEPTRQLSRFHVVALRRRGKSRSITAFVMRSEPLSSS
jgi:hypothetical protein